MRTICQRKLLIWATLSLLFVFMLGSKTFAANAKLLASDGAADNQFGYSVFISGDVVMVGAPNHDDNGTNSGAVYVFRWNGSTSTWEQTQKLLALDGSSYDCFGFSVFISGDVALVGAVFFKNAANPDTRYQYTGAAYVFRWNGSTWVEEQRLLASDALRFDFAGFSVFISGDVALMGAPQHPGNAESSGVAYVFRFNGSAWVEEQKLLASDGAFNDQLGCSVFISGDTALVGAPGRSDNGSRSGAVYVFRWNGSTWVEVQKLLASDGTEGDLFGMTVSISGDVALVGAIGDYNNNGLRSGSAYILRWNGSAWEEKQKLLAPDGAEGDYFGSSVFISGDVALVGAPYDDDQGTDSGSVYVYNVSITYVSIDIKPGAFPNSINVRNEGLIPVAILTTGDFDASTINPDSVIFAGAGKVRSAMEDVDLDGDLDMILHFKTQETDLGCEDISASLTGQTIYGDSIEGHDSIVTMGCK